MDRKLSVDLHNGVVIIRLSYGRSGRFLDLSMEEANKLLELLKEELNKKGE